MQIRAPELLLAPAAILALAWLGPYGTYGDLTLPERLAYWGVGVTAIWVPTSFATRLLHQAKWAARWPTPLRALSGVFVAAAPGTLTVMALEAMLRDSPPLASNLPRLFLSVFVVAALIAVPVNAILESRASAEEDEGKASEGAASDIAGTAPSPPGADGQFLARIPPELGKDLLYVKAEDHYLRVRTPLGSALLLMRMSDAEAELSALDGLRVHRSYWIARGAVSGVDREPNRTWLLLSDGARIPISRSYLPNVRRAGWLDGAGS